MRGAIALLLVVLLGACATGARNVPPSVVYDFGRPVARLSADGAWSGLALIVRSPPWFDSLNVDYRLVYDDPLILREYAGSRWAGAPGVLLAQRLAQQLGVMNNGGSASGSSVCLLRVDLQEFVQRFDTPQQSVGVVQGSVSVFGVKRQLLAERQFVVEQSAGSANAQGGAKALVAASNEFGRQVYGWLDATENMAVKDCRRSGAGAR